MRLAGRIERLDQARGEPSPELPELELAPELLERIEAAQAAGTYPHSLSTPDLWAIREAADKAGWP